MLRKRITKLSTSGSELFQISVLRARRSGFGDTGPDRGRAPEIHPDTRVTYQQEHFAMKIATQPLVMASEILASSSARVH